MNAQRNGTAVRTGLVRFSYLSVFTPKAQRDDKGNLGEAKYSAQILIPKNDPHGTLNAMKEAVKEAGRKKYGDKFDGMVKNKVLRLPFRDGDAENEKNKAQDKETHPEWAGHYYVNVNSKDKPQVVGPSLQPLTDPSTFRSGDYGSVHINAFAYDRNGNKGITFGINAGFQKLRDGEPLDGRARATSVFEMQAEAEGDSGSTGSDDEDFGI